MLMKKTLLMVLLLVGLSSFSMAHAVVSLDIPKLNLNKSFTPALTQTRCDKITKAIENRIDTFEKRNNLHVPAYENLKLRLDNLIPKLETLGYDVTNLKANVSILNNKISKLENDYTTFINKLNEIKNYACDHTDSEVKVKLIEARTLLKNVRSDDDDVRNYIKNVIRPDIVDVKNQK